KRRGPYATEACTNCRKKHVKCSEEATCTYCASNNLKCTYVKSVKKRGPKTTNRLANVFENYLGECENIEQEYTLTLTEHQFGMPIPLYLNYNEEFRLIQTSFFPHINIDSITPNNNTLINFSNTFSLPNNNPPSLASIVSNLDSI
ncbi:17247_t:CDS:1, partial [Dentiscutata heterogama]